MIIPDIEKITNLQRDCVFKKALLYVFCTLLMSLWYGLAFVVNQKFKNKIYNLGKKDDSIPMLQLARSRSTESNKNETKT